MTKAESIAAAEEGLRTRKRRETRERIARVAIELFLRQGFDETTIDEIARGADVSKRSFFDYFATKEDVIGAWQDEFGATLAAAVAARPRSEPLTTVVEEALTEAIRVSLHPQALALEQLVRSTPVLRARDQLKYMKLEQILSEALLVRVTSKPGEMRARLLAAIFITCIRVGGDAAQSARRTRSMTEWNDYTRDSIRAVWTAVQELGAEVERRPARPKTSAAGTKPSARKRKS